MNTAEDQIPELDTVSTSEEKEQASAQGWKEEERDDFKTAHDFLEFGKKVNPIQNERNEHLSKKVDQLERSNKEMKEAFFKSRHDAKEDGYKKAKADLIAEQKRAFDNVDEPAYSEATAKLEKLEPPKKEKQAEETPAVDPDWPSWRAENATWYGQDIAMTAAADAIGRALAPQTDLTGKPFFDVVLKQIKKDFPHKFGNPNRQNNANTVEGGGQTPAKPNGKKGYANLPADIKAASDHAIKSFGYKDREEYAKSWFKQADQYGWEY